MSKSVINSLFLSCISVIQRHISAIHHVSLSAPALSTQVAATPTGRTIAAYAKCQKKTAFLAGVLWDRNASQNRKVNAFVLKNTEFLRSNEFNSESLHTILLFIGFSQRKHFRFSVPGCFRLGPRGWSVSSAQSARNLDANAEVGEGVGNRQIRTVRELFASFVCMCSFQ